jgi:hypothetical protein
VAEIDYSLMLASADRAGGYSIVADERHNISLLRWSEPVAWFSAMLSEETIRAFLELIKSLMPDREERNGR